MNNFNHCKHPDDWIKWIHSVKINKNIHLDYLGSGPKLKTSIAQNKILKTHSKNIINFTGRIDNFAKKVQYIKSWDLFVYEIPSPEGVSMSLLESLACGIPALINDKPGNNEIISNGVNGWICKSRKEMINKMSEYSNSPKMLNNLKKSTINYYKQYLSGNIMMEKYLNLIKSFDL
jgi:glycosyltransferase involved in cell wall biosynthesis